jgi:serine-type D-Ala-D-Ala carboxypeptidase/endopeptidase
VNAKGVDLEPMLEGLGAKGHRVLVAGVICGGEQFHRGWDRDGDPPHGKALFEIGSITKAFTGVLLADMVGRGEVSFDDPLSRYLAGPLPAWRHREPTLLELVTHRTGLPNTPRAVRRRELAYAMGFGSRDPWASLTKADYHAHVSRESPRRAPGGRVGYSSMGVGLLGDALAACAGSSYEQLLTHRVLQPLGMRDTSVTVPPSKTAFLLDGHSRRGHPRPPIEDFMPAAGSLRSNVEDMLRFLAACLRPPEGPIGAALALAQQPQARIRRGMQAGLGWIILEQPRRPRVIWHNGGTWGFRAFAGFAPDPGAAVVVMSNTARSVDHGGLHLLWQAAGDGSS